MDQFLHYICQVIIWAQRYGEAVGHVTKFHQLVPLQPRYGQPEYLVIMLRLDLFVVLRVRRRKKFQYFLVCLVKVYELAYVYSLWVQFCSCERLHFWRLLSVYGRSWIFIHSKSVGIESLSRRQKPSVILTWEVWNHGHSKLWIEIGEMCCVNLKRKICIILWTLWFWL